MRVQNIGSTFSIKGVKNMQRDSFFHSRVTLDIVFKEEKYHTIKKLKV
jgi:hypothetical protein